MKNADFTEKKWERLGLIFKPDTRLVWSKSHAMIPTPFKLDGKQLIYYSGRNTINQSSIGCFEVLLDEKPSVVKYIPVALKMSPPSLKSQRNDKLKFL